MLTLKSFALLVSTFGWGLAVTKWVQAGPLVTDTAGYPLGLALGAGGLIVAALVNAAGVYALGIRHGIQLERDRG